MKIIIKRRFLIPGIFLFCVLAVIAGDKVSKINDLKATSSIKNEINQTIDVEESQIISEKEPMASPTRAGEEINWQVISNGGTKGTSANYLLNGTASQTASDKGSSENYIVHHGFWQNFDSGPCDCEPGEVDGLELINILDVVYLINFKYKEGPAPIPYELCSGDPNKDCLVNILDVVYLINFKYKEGPAPVLCEEWTAECGVIVKK